MDTIAPVLFGVIGALLSSSAASMALFFSRANRQKKQEREFIDFALYAAGRAVGEDVPPGQSETASIEERIQRIHILSGELDLQNRELKSAFDIQIAATERAQAEAQASRGEAESAAAIAGMKRRQVEATQDLIETTIREQLRVAGRADVKFQIWLSITMLLLGVILAQVIPWTWAWVNTNWQW